MGCGGSKVDDLPLVNLCRERKQLIKAASDHRYALAASHVSYFRSLKEVGDALCRFVDEELIIGVTSPPHSPVLTLPSDEGKKKKKKKKSSSSSTSTSLSHSVSLSHQHSHSPDENDSHLHFASNDSDTDSVLSSNGHIHISPERERERELEPEPYSSPRETDSYSFYMKKSSIAVPSVIYEEEKPRVSPRRPQWPDSPYSSYPPQYGNGGYFGVPMSMGSGSPRDTYYRDPYYNNRSQSPPPNPTPPPPPPPPEVSAWDFLNPFELFENTYPIYQTTGKYGVRSNTSSSPDSTEVRQREGIPDLEDETEQEQPVMKKDKQKQKLEEKNVIRDFGEGTSSYTPVNEGRMGSSVEKKEIKSSSETSASNSKGGEDDDEEGRKKGVSFEVDASQSSAQDVESSKPSSLTTLSTHGTRDIQEAVKEIRDEFEIASDYGKEVAVMLEVGKLPYQPRSALLKVISSRILNLITLPMVTSSHPPSRRQAYHTAASVMKMAKTKYGDSEKDFRIKSGNLSSTLERLYAWEKKLYKEVKDEERLRLIYEKKCKRLKILDDRGAESNKIDATQASITKLLTKINVAIRTVDAIASRIHKLRDEELQPQISELINGLIRMWKSMLKCHQKQFQAIIESKSHTLMANTGVRRDSSLRATVELEMDLLNWCTQFNNWINTQKAYVESLNGWLLRCLLQEPEETPDGIVPFSPSRVGAPLVFIIGNDWYHAMERLSETEVVDAMHDFALSLHQLWERQDEEQRQRLKAEYLSKDFEKRLRSLHNDERRMQRDQDASSDKSVVPTENGVSPLDDLKVDLDSMRKRLEEEKARHKETVRQVHKAASSSLQAGLIPIFGALGNFTSETLKAYEQVRIQNAGGAM